MADLDLSPEHYALLRASGITDALIAARGYRSLDAEQAQAELPQLGYADYQVTGSGLLVPLWDVHGQNGASQFRSDHPRVRSGKPVKYETPSGARNMIDLPPTMREHLGKTTVALLVTEGARKADALASSGYLVIDLSGVWNWRGRTDNDTTAPLPDFNAIPHKDRRVCIVFDSDARYNPDVQKAMSALMDYLKGRGAIVTCHLPPAGANGEKQGVDDYIAAGGSVPQLLSEVAFNPDAIGRTAAELRAEPQTMPDWLIPGVTARGWKTL